MNPQNAETIKPLSAEEIVVGLERLIPKDVDILHEIKSDRVFCSRQAIAIFLRSSLASYAAYLKEQMPKERNCDCDDADCGTCLWFTGWNAAISNISTVFDEKINKLTK